MKYVNLRNIILNMTVEEIDKLLSNKIGLTDIRTIVAWTNECNDNQRLLWKHACSGLRRESVNALWVMTHLPESCDDWLLSLQGDMIDMLLSETDTTKKRLFLQLLREQEYEKNSIRTDFLEYCLGKINSECESYAVRCFSLYAAFKMCMHYPELIDELEYHLNMMTYQTLSPGLKSAFRQIKKKIERLRNKQICK